MHLPKDRIDFFTKQGVGNETENGPKYILLVWHRDCLIP